MVASRRTKSRDWAIALRAQGRGGTLKAAVVNDGLQLVALVLGLAKGEKLAGFFLVAGD